MIRFIHCADIHLGKIQNNLEQRFEDFGTVFQAVVNEAIERQVNFLLIAGDLFDKRNINARTLEQAVRILEPLKEAEIPVIAIEGNHDKAFLRDKESWMSFLANRGYIVLLSPGFEGGKLVIEPYDYETCSGCYIDLPEEVRVYGLGYLGRAAGEKVKELADMLPEDKANILLLHAMVGRMGGDMIGSIPKGDVACLQQRVSYLALGHGHNRYVVEQKRLQPEEMVVEECIIQFEDVQIESDLEGSCDSTQIVSEVAGTSEEVENCDSENREESTTEVEEPIEVCQEDSPEESTSLQIKEIAMGKAAKSNLVETMQLSLFDMLLDEIAAEAEDYPTLEGENGDLTGEGLMPGMSVLLDRIREEVKLGGLNGIVPTETEEVYAEAEDLAKSFGHNPGSLEHCRLDEAEHQHGFYYAEMTGKELTKVEYIPSNPRPARIVVIDISGSNEPDAAYTKIIEAVRAVSTGLENPLIRVVVKGDIGFDILELDEELIRGQIIENFAPLILEIDIRANLPQFRVATDVEMLDRHSIEREVLRKKVENRAQWRHLGNDLVNLILEIKEDVINGVPAEEVAAKVLSMAGGNSEDS